MDIANIFTLPDILPKTSEKELFEPLLKSDNILIERIVSTGQITPTNEWYEQERAEWVVLLQGEAKILFDNEEGEIAHLQKGNYLFIEAMRKHRVVFTSLDEPCVWLAIHCN
ncbi:MAG: cupin domain-containing protein [Chitinophagales bacterium]